MNCYFPKPIKPANSIGHILRIFEIPPQDSINGIPTFSRAIKNKSNKREDRAPSIE